MARKQGSIDIAPRIRGAVKRALTIVEDSKEDRKYAGMSLSEMFADMIMDGDLERVINMASKFTPKELLIDVDTAVTLDLSGLPPEMIKEVFSAQPPAITGGDQGGPGGVQGANTLEATTGTPVRGLPSPS